MLWAEIKGRAMQRKTDFVEFTTEITTIVTIEITIIITIEILFKVRSYVTAPA